MIGVCINSCHQEAFSYLLNKGGGCRIYSISLFWIYQQVPDYLKEALSFVEVTDFDSLRKGKCFNNNTKNQVLQALEFMLSISIAHPTSEFLFS